MVSYYREQSVCLNRGEATLVLYLNTKKGSLVFLCCHKSGAIWFVGQSIEMLFSFAMMVGMTKGLTGFKKRWSFVRVFLNYSQRNKLSRQKQRDIRF